MDYLSANAVRRQLLDLSNKIGPTLQPAFISKKLEQDLKRKEAKPSIVNQLCVVYHFVGVSKTQTSKTRTSHPKNTDPRGVSKTEILKTQTLGVSRKLRS